MRERKADDVNNKLNKVFMEFLGGQTVCPVLTRDFCGEIVRNVAFNAKYGEVEGILLYWGAPITTF